MRHQHNYTLPDQNEVTSTIQGNSINCRNKGWGAFLLQSQNQAKVVFDSSQEKWSPRPGPVHVLLSQTTKAIKKCIEQAKVPLRKLFSSNFGIWHSFILLCPLPGIAPIRKISLVGTTQKQNSSPSSSVHQQLKGKPLRIVA